MKTLIIDTVDFTSYFARSGYQVAYDIREGGAAGFMLDGTDSVDELAVKAKLVLPCLPLTDAQIQRLLQVLMPTPLHTVQYYDPERGVRIATMRRSAPKTKYSGYGGDGSEYWAGGMVIELTEK